MQLRNYQQEAVTSVIKHFNQGIFRQLIVLPTGAGKTIVMAALAKHFNKRMLLLAHRDELLTQAYDKFKSFWPESDIGYSKAGFAELDHRIVMGSVQSCSRAKRLEKLKEQSFDILMVDEAHHAPANTYDKIIKALGFDGGTRLLIGVTATPRRGDKKGLGNIFEKITYTKTISSLIDEKYLSPIIGRKILTKTDLEGVSTRMGDFVVGELATAINIPNRNKFIVQKVLEHAPDRKLLAFCADVQHCHDLAAEMNKSGIKTQAVWGSMSRDDRQQALSDFHNGTLQAITSCALLTEGYDESGISAIAMCRPTKSPTLYQQCIGRGTRLHEGKSNLLVLDFMDEFHKLDAIVTLSKTVPDAEVINDGEFDDKISVKLDKEVINVKVIPHLDEIFDLFEFVPKYIWSSLDDCYSLIDSRNNEIIVTRNEDGYMAMLYSNDSEFTLVYGSADLTDCIKSCEEYGEKHLDLIHAGLNLPWHNDPATVAQIDMLKNNSYSVTPGMTKLEAAIYIRHIKAHKNARKRESNTKKMKSPQYIKHTANRSDHMHAQP